MNRSSISLTFSPDLLATALLATAGLSLASPVPAAQAASSMFSEQSVNASQFVVMAAPRNNQDYNLVVLEQKSASRDCWTENNGVINPLLLNFDFSGICGRATDSNGYSLRMAGEDLGLQYSLRLVDRGNYVALLATPNRRNQSVLEIGRTQNSAQDYLAVKLNPGWNLSRRVYDGKALGHVYFSNEMSLANTIAAAPSTPTAIANPAVPKPVVAPPAIAKPVTTRPVTTQPITTRPITTRPIATRPVTTQPNLEIVAIGKPLPKPPVLPGRNVASAPVSIPVEQPPVPAPSVQAPTPAPKVVISQPSQPVSPLASQPHYAPLNGLYQEILARPVDASGLATYGKQLDQGKGLDWVSDRLRNSSEGKTVAINRLYREVLGREADSRGLNTYRKRLDRGWTLSQVRSSLADSTEGRQRLANR